MVSSLRGVGGEVLRLWGYGFRDCGWIPEAHTYIDAEFQNMSAWGLLLAAQQSNLLRQDAIGRLLLGPHTFSLILCIAFHVF